MRIKKGFELRTVCQENLIVAFGEENIDFSKLISLNSSAAAMWRAVEGKDFDVDDMASALIDEFEVEREVAFNDAREMLSQWIEAGLVE